MNILVLGGSGFIGTCLVSDLLKQGHKVTIYDKVVSLDYPELVCKGDVRDVDNLTKACNGKDAIYNLAAEHADDVSPKSLYADVNIGGAQNTVLAATANNINKIIFTSTVAVYGLNRGTPNESVDAQPFNEYGRTKHEAENIFNEWADQDEDNSLTIIRPAVIFGENNRGNVYNLINQIVSGKFLMVGDGKNRKSMGYVKNISAFLSNQLDKNAGLYIYNYCDKPDLSSKEIVDIVKNEMDIKGKSISVPYFIGLIGGYVFDILSKLTGKTFPISSIRIKKFCAETTVNTDKLIESGFKKPFTLESGIRNMIKFEFKNKN